MVFIIKDAYHRLKYLAVFAAHVRHDIEVKYGKPASNLFVAWIKLGAAAPASILSCSRAWLKMAGATELSWIRNKEHFGMAGAYHHSSTLLLAVINQQQAFLTAFIQSTS